MVSTAPQPVVVWLSLTARNQGRAVFHAEQSCAVGGADPSARIPTGREWAYRAGAGACSRCAGGTVARGTRGVVQPPAQERRRAR